MNSVGIIYIATSNTTGKCYIGQTTRQLEERIREHESHINAKHNNHKFSNALKKYGSNDFIWKILINNVPEENLNFMETMVILLYNSYYNGYNSTFGGEAPMRNKHHSEEAKKKISENRIYKTGPDHSNYGKKYLWLSERNRKKLWKVPSGENNKISKTYIITYPDGTEITVKGITQFCRENNLDQGNMCRVARGEQKQYKGFLCKEKITNESN